MTMTPEAPHRSEEVQVRFGADGRPLAIRRDGRIWAVDPDSDAQHWSSRWDWWSGEISAAVGEGDVVSVENWRVQVRHSTAAPLRTFELRRDPLSEQWPSGGHY
jgi:hypothetical protein